MRRKAVDNLELERWRSMPALVVLKALADHIKQDPDFEPLSSRETTRWHVSIQGQDYEFLCTGAKFYDTRQQHGGGGAIDLIMHLYQLDFKRSVQRLRSVL